MWTLVNEKMMIKGEQKYADPKHAKHWAHHNMIFETKYINDEYLKMEDNHYSRRNVLER